MKKTRWLLSLACLSLLLSLLSGCSNYVEIEKLIIVAGAAIDFDPSSGDYTVTTEILNLQNSGGNDSDYETIYMQSSGASLVEAINDMTHMAGRQLYWGHADVFILSRSVLQHSIEPILDWFASDVNTRLSSMVIVAGTEKASEIYQMQTLGQKSVSISLEQILENYQNRGHTVVNVNELINRYGIQGAATCIPIVSGQTNQEQELLSISSYAVLKQDVLSGIYEGSDVPYLMLMMKNPFQSVLSVPIANENLTVQVKVVSHSISLRTDCSRNAVSAQIEMKLNLSLVGHIGDDTMIRNADGTERIIQAAEQEVRDACCALLDRDIHQFGTDILCIGQHIKRHDPKIWHHIAADWDWFYANMPYEMHVHAVIDQSGKMSPLNDQEEIS